MIPFVFFVGLQVQDEIQSIWLMRETPDRKRVLQMAIED